MKKNRFNKAKEEQTRESKSSIWESSYGKELIDKYTQQKEQQEREQRELEEKYSKKAVSLDNTAVSKLYDIGDVISHGDFGTVVRSAKSKDGKQVAIKVLDKESYHEVGITPDTLKQQIEIIKSLKDDHFCVS